MIGGIFSVFVLLTVANVNCGDYTSTAVHGTLKCKGEWIGLIVKHLFFPGQPAGGELMVIVDESKNIHKALEHAIGRGVSLADGSFLVSGRYRGQMDPVIKV